MKEREGWVDVHHKSGEPECYVTGYQTSYFRVFKKDQAADGDQPMRRVRVQPIREGMEVKADVVEAKSEAGATVGALVVPASWIGKRVRVVVLEDEVLK